MKTILLLTGMEDEKELFRNAIRNNFCCKFGVLSAKEFDFKDNFQAFNYLERNIEELKDSTYDGIMIIENYNCILSGMIQDDFPIFEIKLVDKMGVLSNTAFTLNWKSEDFEKEAVELITKLAF